MNLQVGVKALIRNTKDQYLFLQRSEKISTDTNKTSWDIPGGRINPDESLVDALKREINEEIGVTLELSPTLIAAQDIFVPAKDFHVVRLTYIIEANPENIILSDEHESYKWVHKRDLKTIEVEPYLAEVIARNF